MILESNCVYDNTNCHAIPSASTIFINVGSVDNLVLRTKECDYVLDFQRLLEDYGIKVQE